MSQDRIVERVLTELGRAEEIHPNWPEDPMHAITIVAEELGEVQKALLEMVYEPQKGVSVTDVYKEAVQLAAMSLRFLKHIERYRYEASLIL